jgi:hypothetical protein
VTASTTCARAFRRRTANAQGTFTIAFPVRLSVEPCHGTLAISARGSLGSRATLRRPCRPGDPLPP